MKILIADDDGIAIRLLRRSLEQAGYEIEVARDGNEAWEMIQRSQYRLVITDWEMPGINGIELCRRIRQQSYSGYVYVIMLTGHSSSEQIVEGMSAGADDFITKPFKPAELLVRVRAGERVLALEQRELVIFAMAKLAESRDPETGHHLERVQEYSRVLAQYIKNHDDFKGQVDDDFVRLVYLTSPLHDIGKVGIPDAVLLKPGRLSDEEFEIMKSHTVIGATTLEAALIRNPNARFLRIARDIALSHHERFDGRGYPHGRKGDEIPLAARVVAVADVYDALTSKRVYKEAYTHLVARRIISDDSGTHFDPRIVEGFLACQDEFLRIGQLLREGDSSHAPLAHESALGFAGIGASIHLTPV